MKKIKITSLLLSVMMIIALFNGCSQKNIPKTGEKIEIEYWTINLKKNFQPYIESIISKYESAHPNVKIKWVDVPGADVTKKMITALSSTDVPDVVNETILGYSQLKSYDVLLPISDYTKDSDLAPYVEGLLDGLKIDGKVMALPWYNGGPYVGYINSEVYQKAGLDPNSPPKTFDELLANGKTIHQKLPNVFGSNDFPTVQVLQAEGLPLVSADKKTAVFNSPQHIAFIQKFVDAYKNGSLAPGSIGIDDRAFQQAFNTEQTGQIGWWFAFEITNWEKNTPAFPAKVKVVPAVTGAKGLIPIKDTQLLFVPKRTAHPKEAVEFALYVTNVENQTNFCKLVAIFPSTKDTFKDPYFTNITGNKLSDQARKIMIEDATKLTVSEIASLNSSQSLLDIYNEEVRAALSGSKSVKDALDAAVKAWGPILAK